MIYAIFEDGSRNYMVDRDQLITVDQRDAKPGERVEFDRVLMLQTGAEAHVGQPVVEGAKVIAEVVDHPSTKTIIQKFRRRKTYRRLRGHRQFFTRVRILDLVLPGWERPAPAVEQESLADELADEEEFDDEEFDDEEDAEEDLNDEVDVTDDEKEADNK